MHIKITNFHNISSLDYNIVDGKVNFLYGVSGSGKSSIVRGIARNINPMVDPMVGSSTSHEVAVLIDGSAGPLESTMTFDRERQSALFSPSPDRSFYDVFIGDEEVLNTLRDQYKAAVSSLQARTGDLLRIKSEVEVLIKTLGKASRGGFTGASKMGKAIKAYDSASEATRSYVERRGMAATTWVHEGFAVDDSYTKGVCPFCEQDLKSCPDREVLDDLHELSVKDLKPLFDSPSKLAALGQDPIDIATEKGRARAVELVDSLPKVCAEIDRVVRYCNVGIDYQTVREMTIDTLRLDPAIYVFMPELREVTEAINAKATEIKNLLAEMKKAFNVLVKNGCTELNHKLTKFGIPYRFELSTANRDDKTASYRLVHVKASNSTDMRESLSFGERNLITLILFLQNEDSEVMLIDDPASSYDDYRRTQIFKLIMGVQGKTLLVVSHDQAFVRRAVHSRSEHIGNVDMLCNRSGNASVEPITKESFGYFEDTIRNRIGLVPGYYQRMLNARLICEVHGAELNDKVLWGYVSAILHQSSRDEILALLENANESEEKVLGRLRGLVGKNAAQSIIPVPKEIDYSTDGFSEFERLIALREALNAPGGGSALPKGITKNLAIDLLNDLVHMNDAMMDCIDPYRYPVWSPILFSLLES